jgi:hypothetical protein
MLKFNFFKTLMFSSMLLIIGCSEQNAETAMREIKARYHDQIEFKDLTKPRKVLINQEKLDKQITILSKIKTDMDDVVVKHPNTKAVSDWQSNSDLSSFSFNKNKIDKTIAIFNHEKTLFRTRDKILELEGSNSKKGIFNFKFGEKFNSSCTGSARVGFPPSARIGFYPRLEHKSLKRFFLKFDKLVDSLIFNRELIQKALKELKEDDLAILNISPTSKALPKHVYSRMLADFVGGNTIRLFLSLPDQVTNDFLQQSNTVLASCISGEKEFVDRVGTWLPKDSNFSLEAVGNKKDQVPVYVTLYGDTPAFDRKYFYEPVVNNLKKKYGRPLFWTFDEQFWITDDGRLIIVKEQNISNGTYFSHAETSLSYIYLPMFIKNYQTWLDLYNNALTDFIQFRSENIKDLKKSTDEELKSKL